MRPPHRRGGRTRSGSPRRRAGRRPWAGGCRAAGAWRRERGSRPGAHRPRARTARRTLPSASLPATSAARPGARSTRSPGRSRLPGRASAHQDRLVDPLDQGDLDRHRAAAGEEAGRQHAGVVEHQQVAAVAAGPAGRAPAVSRNGAVVDQQQPRGVARPDRCLRDQLGRQVEVEQVDAHGFRETRTRRDRWRGGPGQAGPIKHAPHRNHDALRLWPSRHRAGA